MALLAVPLSAFPLDRAALAADPLPSDQWLVVSGGGWGHGRGMGQYGARAQAEAGRTWQTILHSYYSGIDLTDRGAESIRVKLFNGSTSVIGGPETVTAKWSSGTTIATSTSSYPYFRVRTTSDGIEIDKGSSPTGPWDQITAGTSRVRFTTTTVAVPVYQSGQLRYYRGYIEVVRGSSSGTLYTVNRLKMDEYLYGVVPREMPSSWHGQALRAQAVAARTYSAFKKVFSSNSVYDICGTEACQVYGGYGYRSSPGSALTVVERSSTNGAVDDTSGMVMTYGGDPIFSEFSSSTGGHTSDGDKAYLKAVADPWDETYSPHHRWTAFVRVSEIEAKWSSIGRLVGISGVKRDGDGPWGGRVSSLTLNGTNGSTTISGSSFRLAFPYPSRSSGVRSNLFTIGIYDGEPSGTPAEVLVKPGDSATAVVYMKNTGNRSWKVGDRIELRVSPSGRDSAFADGGWISSSRVTAVTADATDDGGSWVSPGQVAEFRFPIRAPADMLSGVYSETFALVAAGYTWFGDPVTIPIRVGLAGAAHLGANMVDNASFEASSDGIPSRWKPYNQSSGLLDRYAGIDGSTAAKLTGDRDLRKNLWERVYKGGKAGDGFVFSLWNRATGTSSSGGNIDAQVKLRNTDGTSQVLKIVFPKSAHGWVYREVSFKAKKSYRKIDIYLSFRYQSGRTWFDRVRLARNEARNGGFEASSSSPDGWTIYNGGSGDGVDAKGAYSGARALRLKGARGKNVYARQKIYRSGGAGQTIRLAGWNRSEGTEPTGDSVGYEMRVRYTDGTYGAALLDFPRTTHTWGYSETVFTAAKPFYRIDVYADYGDQTGTAWFDEVTVGLGAQAVSLAANAGFELGAPAPGDWEIINSTTSGITTSSVHAGKASLLLDGDPAANVYARQYVPLAGEAGERFRLSGWNTTSGSSSTGGVVEIWCRVRYADGTHEPFVISFSKSAHAWAYGEVEVVAAKPYVRIDVFAKYKQQTGDARFDGIGLARIG